MNNPIGKRTRTTNGLLVRLGWMNLRAGGWLIEISPARRARAMTALKTIIYRGGIARFRVPHSWVEEYEPEGGGTFYEDGPDTGTLRMPAGTRRQAASHKFSISDGRKANKGGAVPADEP